MVKSKSKKEVDQSDRTLSQVEFLRFIEARAVRISPVLQEDYLSSKIKRLSEHVKFKCDFIDGVCRRVREIKENKNNVGFIAGMYSTGCCCGDCAASFGYIRKMSINRIDNYRREWRVKSGFFQAGKGCRLERELRSGTCIRYTCHLVQKDMNKLENEVLNLFHSVE
jgi:hypothetical protein